MSPAERPSVTSTAATGSKAHVIVASNRAANGVYVDRAGPVVVEWLRERGYAVGEPEVVPDGDPVAGALRRAVGAGAAVVITSGGTGINPTDHTPEATAAVLDRELPGLADAVRNAGLPKVPTAVLSRGRAGVAGATLVVNLPGSTGGVRDGLGVLDGVLEHAVDQLAGGDHDPADASASTGGSSAGEVPASVASVVRARVVDEQLDVREHAELVSHRSAGAVVTFSGVVRDHDGGRGVRELEYVGHPSATEVIGEVAGDVVARLSGVRAVAVSHRVGTLGLGEVALACAVAGDHRAEAFTACGELVDEVKRRLPVWKRQVFADGTEEWVNCP